MSSVTVMAMWCWFFYSLQFTVILKRQRASLSTLGEDGTLPFLFTLSYKRGLQWLNGHHTTHSSPASLRTLGLRAQQQRISRSVLSLYRVLSLEQRHHRSGMVAIGRKRCWDGDKNRYHVACLQQSMAQVAYVQGWVSPEGVSWDLTLCLSYQLK